MMKTNKISSRMHIASIPGELATLVSVGTLAKVKIKFNESLQNQWIFPSVKLYNLRNIDLSKKLLVYKLFFLLIIIIFYANF